MIKCIIKLAAIAISVYLLWLIIILLLAINTMP